MPRPTLTTPLDLACRSILCNAVVYPTECSIGDCLPGCRLIDRHRRRVVDPAVRWLVDELKGRLGWVALSDAVTGVDDPVCAQEEREIVVLA